MLKDVKFGFIGSGAMATAMIAGLSKKNLINPDNVTAADPYVGQLEKLSGRYNVKTTQNNLEATKEKDVIILAIKPQNLVAVGEELQGRIPARSLVLSIIAGATISSISRALHHYRVVRVMPNTPARVGKGMSVWTATEDVTETQLQYAQSILAALGEEVFVENEDYLDMATALSGTGPAYVFMFMEAMIDAGVHMGFSRRISEQLVYQTIEGSLAFARDSKRHPAELRNMVTSPGGTTADAIYQLDKGGFRTVLSKAIWAAYKKSRILGGLEENNG
ncbi:MAG: pyrroline-5-carboxylate reductase [Chloroflexi bacterium]|nr:MAG: pyrroline-5-carboxylate reductase [Chloroflexota bacterium]